MKAADLVLDESDGPKPGRARQAALRARLIEAGLVQVAVWVPEGFQPEMQGFAAALRRASGTLLPSETKTDEPSQARASRSRRRGRPALPVAVPRC